MNCQRSRTQLDQDFCTGYLTGTFDSMSAAGSICPRDGATTAQLLAVGRKFIADHPEMWDRHPGIVVQTAFLTAFPCPAR